MVWSEISQGFFRINNLQRISRKFQEELKKRIGNSQTTLFKQLIACWWWIVGNLLVRLDMKSQVWVYYGHFFNATVYSPTYEWVTGDHRTYHMSKYLSQLHCHWCRDVDSVPRTNGWSWVNLIPSSNPAEIKFFPCPNPEARSILYTKNYWSCGEDVMAEAVSRWPFIHSYV